MKRVVLGAAAAVALATLLVASAGAQATDERFRINLKTRSFLPPQAADVAGIRSAREGAGDRVHFLAQFSAIPNAAERSAIAAQGVRLVAYVAANTYVASSSVSALGRLGSIDGLRWAGPLEARDKISSDLARGNIGAWARAGQGRVVLSVMGHQDVALSELQSLAGRHGGQIVGSASLIPSVTAIFAPGRVNQIAREDAVQYVDVVPIPLGEHNDGARPATGATALAAAPYNLNGNGVTVLVYDSGILDNAHGDFAGRVAQFDGDATETTRNHSTHVSGTVGGDGSQSNQNDSAGNPNNGTANQWAGMAPAVTFRSFGSAGSTDTLYNDAGDINADFTTAINAAGGTDIATMSLGNNVVPNGFPCAQLGDYTGTAILLDNIVRGSISGQQLIYFQSAGNERGGAATCGSTFSTISSPATAKNTIVVGAVNSNDNSMTGFSSWGPTDDGRLRPDIVGPGCQSTGDNNITSTGFDDDGDGNLEAGEVQNSYQLMCGTSMSTPASAGTMALLVQRWKTLYGATTRPLGHTAKAIVIHTATDLGNAGPDFTFGWGHINGQAAVDLVNADASANLITVDQVDNGQTDFYTFNSSGATAPRVSLVWSDPAATQLAANTLINDVDLRVTDPDGIVYQPLVLNPTSPANVAAAGNDARNPVEVAVGVAKAGTWTVSVAGTAVPTGPQQYTLITPEDAVANRPPVADANGPYSTPEGTNVQLNATGSSDPDSDPLTYAWDFDADGAFDDAVGAQPMFDLVGQDGPYTVAVKATDDNGAFDVDTAIVNVTNVAPSVLNLASNGPKDEGEAITVTGTISDPGWLEALTATIDWGDGTGVQAIAGGTLENVRPNATLSFSVSHSYGDDSGAGTFTATVCGLDDDTSTCAPIALTITNEPPTAVIDLTGTVLINGIPTFLANEGVPVPFEADSFDIGSDDRTTTWDWGDGAPSPDTSKLSLNDVNFNPDPDPSPTVNPRTVTDSEPHAFGEACFYTVTFGASDDDGGSASDQVKVIITGNASQERGAGYWQTQYRPRPTSFSEERRLCYLAIAGFMSQVFDEVRDASTVPKAFDVLAVNQNVGIAAQQLDRQLLAAWLNFANGAFDLNVLVDTDGDGADDTAFATVMANAEAVRLNPASTEAQLYAQRDILQRINGS